ncbi:MAG: hypothetical protein KJO36_02355, partial [Acidimicrobiia bacterium]|nr:hypothetical protein [Acidimicrobiia bacterium]
GTSEAVGFFDPATGEWTLQYELSGFDTFFYGTPGDQPLIGDWDCDGTDTVAMFRPSTGFIHYRNSNDFGVADRQFFFGNPGDVALAGDWDGDGCDSFGIFRNGTLYLSNQLETGIADVKFSFGIPGDEPFTGDFDGDGIDTIGLYRDTTGFVYLTDMVPGTRSVAPTQASFFYGIPSDRIIAGDWDDDGDDTVGIYRASDRRFYLSNENAQGTADAIIAVGESDLRPLAGKVGKKPSKPEKKTKPTTIVPGDPIPTVTSSPETTAPPGTDAPPSTNGSTSTSSTTSTTSTSTTSSSTTSTSTTSSSTTSTSTTSTSTTSTTSPTSTTTTAAPGGQDPPASIAECLSRPSTEVLSGVYTERIRISSPPDDHTVDARTGISLTSGERALQIGSSRAADGGCYLGWTTIGQQSPTLTWRQMHDDITGSALRVYGSNYVVDGLRARNVEDAFDPRGGEGFEVRNMWTEYVRDDCIENDERRAGSVSDSLFDGCYTFFSEQEAGDVAGESLVFDRVLVRLQPMPGPHGTSDPTILGHGSFFKKFDDGGRHEPIIRDSVFFLEDDCYSGCKDWPEGTVASNVVIVWVGDGDFPMSVLPGMTLTTDRSVWDDAVTEWKVRHGCTTIDAPCTRLHDPL